MDRLPHSAQFIEHITTSISAKSFVRLSLSTYKGSEKDLKNIIVRPVLIKGEEMVSMTYRYKTRDVVKNFSPIEGLKVLEGYIGYGKFHAGVLFTLEGDFYLTILGEDKSSLKRKSPSKKEELTLEHDKKKQRLIQADVSKKYLHELNITDTDGRVYNHGQDKYKQINHYIELLAPLIKELPNKELRVVDMGAGKGYLTFALYDYLTTVLNKKVHVDGVEYRKDLVTLCNTVAQKSGFESLRFVEGTIQDYGQTDIDMLVALHACDTATDDAIAKGIATSADLIVVAPLLS